MIGGFLGAGKTTAVGKLARWWTEKGSRVGLIVNDQGSHLVDTTTLAACGFSVEEIPGGCFCCRFNSLVDAARRLTEQGRPDVFIAEPVGSCTDLIATVNYPLRKMYGADFSIAPLSVMVDPIRALRILGLEPGGKFSDKVTYIYRKQLEEADLIVVNKCDLLTNEQTATLDANLARHFPKARILNVSARHGTGLETWFGSIINSSPLPRATMEVDYEVYADGEARLGWLNCTFRLQARLPINGNTAIQALANNIQTQLSKEKAEVAHLKMTLDAANDLGDLAVINVVRNDLVPELSQHLQDDFLSGELTINMRAEAEPDSLRHIVEKALEKLQAEYLVSLKREHLEAFRPGKPQPTHRIPVLS
jgi:G3E family GTPase